LAFRFEIKGAGVPASNLLPKLAVTRQICRANFAAGVVDAVAPIHLGSAVVECVDELMDQGCFGVSCTLQTVLA
jgi:hypothetical protein